MNILEAIHFLLLPVLKDKDLFSIEIVEKETGRDVLFKLSSTDAKKIFASGGRLFRALKNIIRYALSDMTVNLVIDIQKGA
jgi:predicted RNA-binding protein YlqC (UPF0109 family)